MNLYKKALETFHRMQYRAFDIWWYESLVITMFPYTVYCWDQMSDGSKRYDIKADGGALRRFFSQQKLESGTVIYILCPALGADTSYHYLAVTENVFREEMDRFCKETGVASPILDPANA